MIRLRRPRWRRWCEIKFRWKHGWWCQHNVKSDWEPIENGFYQIRQCRGCGLTELR